MYILSVHDDTDGRFQLILYHALTVSIIKHETKYRAKMFCLQTV